jgi:transposase-like protein
VLSIDGTFLIGRYESTLSIAIAVNADNALVSLAFGLVERENKASWGWFLRLVRIHVVGPGKEVGIISDRHQGILSAVQEQIPGYAPLHHRWCTRHMAQNLLDTDGNKDNFALFKDVACQLEEQFFQVKLEELKTATNDAGRRWLRGVMSEPEKWSRAYVAVGMSFRLATWPSQCHRITHLLQACCMV